MRKALSFSAGEWERVERRMRAAGARKFEPFARAAVLDGEVRVQRVAFDPSVLRVELARIGNNINQIARHVNTESGVTFEEMRAARMLLTQVQASISRALSQVPEGD
ncbi:hypothetical protein NS220_14250 [Microbacterium testaceum]|uniref:Bacterial mobilisation domain-containing protein n=1 Tax=Microbacterium testaceum TaxID=2033 RepID=A0A147EUG1_MICTE|nr:hypothetical protein NS220_14250 [Microbacterium testaceum]